MRYFNKIWLAIGTNTLYLDNGTNILHLDNNTITKVVQPLNNNLMA